MVNVQRTLAHIRGNANEFQVSSFFSIFIHFDSICCLHLCSSRAPHIWRLIRALGPPMPHSSFRLLARSPARTHLAGCRLPSSLGCIFRKLGALHVAIAGWFGGFTYIRELVISVQVGRFFWPSYPFWCYAPVQPSYLLVPGLLSVTFAPHIHCGSAAYTCVWEKVSWLLG